jgi:UDP-N-acetylmuramate dehydrogenase
VGGRAQLLLRLETLADLTELAPVIAADDRPLLVVGRGSNLLVADEGFAGIVIVLGDEFRDLTIEAESDAVTVTAGAALDLPVLARRVADQGVAGFEWAVGVPGSVGGAVAMNAGGHGGDMAHCVRVASGVDLATGTPRTWTLADLAYRYRGSALGPRDLVTGVTLDLIRGDREVSRAQIKEIVAWRRAHQPGGANCGSVFRNPPGEAAGALIERAGLKGYRVGTAHVSEKHANFIQADDDGRADDVAALMREVRALVEERCGALLESEVRTVGFGTPWP